MKTAHLILTHKWYDLIEQGKKNIEYRRNTAYYRTRLKDATHVCLHRAYTNTTMTFKIFDTVYRETIEIHLAERVA